MISSWPFFIINLVSALVLLVINGMLVSAEASLVKLRYSLKERATLDKLRALWRIGYIFRRAKRVASVVRFGIMALTCLAAIQIFALLEYLFWDLFFIEIVAGFFPWGLLALLIDISLVSLLGYLLPRGVALARPQRVLKATSWGVVLLTFLLEPLFKLQRLLGNLILSPFGIRYGDTFNVLDFEVQIGALGEDDSVLSPRLQGILRNALRMRELDVSSILLPRNQVRAFELGKSVEENLEMARETGHTRFPLCDGDLDNCEGIIHIKDIFRYRGATDQLKLTELKREIRRFNEDTPLELALQELLQHKVHMALVTDEFGGVLGVITLESILEELVGDIEDEFDVAEPQLIRVVSPGAFRVDGLAPVHELEDALGVKIQSEEAATFGGLVTSQIGRIPGSGETLLLEDPAVSVTIEEADETRVLTAVVKVAEATEEA